MIRIQDVQSDPSLTDQFIEQNFGLVYSIANRFKSLNDSDDYFQVGCIGLLKSINGYKSEFETAFATYAVPVITGEIKRYIRDTSFASRRIQEINYTINKLRKIGMPDSDICVALGISMKKIEEADFLVAPHISLNELAYEFEEGSSIELMANISTGECIETDIVESIATSEKLHCLIDSLSPKLLKILNLYAKHLSQQQIASVIGVSQAQIGRYLKSIRTRYAQICNDYENNRPLKALFGKQAG